MKLFRNPIVVGALAVIALALVIYQLTPQLRRRSAASNPRPAAVRETVTGTPASPQEITDETAPPSNVLTAAAMDLASIESGANNWLKAPRRDPFKVRFYTSRGTNTAPASQLLTLAAIWHQDQSSFAVINKTIMREGDPILDFTLAKIETSGIWVEGPNGREFVGFKATGGEAEPNASTVPPVSLVPNASAPRIISGKPVP